MTIISVNAIIRVETAPDDPSVACIVIDNPPVNAGSLAVREGLIAAIDHVRDAPSIKAAILMGAGSTFIAGSDIKEFDAPLADPQLPAVIAAIESCSKPIVAAIYGAALGGGYDVALGCDARIAADDAIVGLPEVSLGLIPGAGGTLRLTRITDAATALEAIVSGRRIRAPEALALGMIDAVAEGDLKTFATRYAASLARNTGKRRLCDLPPKAIDPLSVEQVAGSALKRAKFKKPVIEAIAAVKRAVDLPFRNALAQERATFQVLRQSEEAAALRHLFFAERQAGRIQGVKAKDEVRTVAVIGAGTMGAGIASAFLASGFRVHMLDTTQDSLSRGLSRVDEIDRQGISAGRIDEAEYEDRRSRLSSSTELASVAESDLIVEAVFEDMDVKKELFSRLEKIVRQDAILASNTSYLNLDIIAAATSAPERVVGLHFFSPAHVMRLVEVVQGQKTSQRVLAQAVGISRKLKKLPVIARVGEGFIGNRIFMAYRTQCEYMLEDGATPEIIDHALTEFGFAMGPFAVWDLSGLDIAWRTRQRLAVSRPTEERYVPVLDRLCEAGHMGRKTGSGWYKYSDNARKSEPNALTDELIRASAAEKGITRRPVSGEEIVSRALAAILNEAAHVLNEGIAERPADIDLVLVNGYGFPSYRGGPIFWASQRSRAEIVHGMGLIAKAAGEGFKLGPIERLLDCAKAYQSWS